MDQATSYRRFFTIASIAALSARFFGKSGSAAPSSANAEVAIGGNTGGATRSSLRGGRVTCTFNRIEVTCQPCEIKNSCNFGNCCFSFAAKAAFGVDSTS